MTAAAAPFATPRRTLASRVRAIGVFRVAIVLIGFFVALAVVAVLGSLASLAWQKYGTSVLTFYWTNVFGKPSTLELVRNTAIIVMAGCTIATLTAALLAWINERTNASVGTAGRFLPLIPFFMPALSFPLGWVFLASPKVGLLNVFIRNVFLEPFGIHLETGPFDVFSWYGMIFLYSVPLCAFAYLVISSAMRNLDGGLEEAAKMAGANPVKILLGIVFPALRPAMISTFLICLIPAVGMLSIPLTIGTSAKIGVLSVHVLHLVTATFPAAYGDAFLIGLLLVLPILLATWLQRRSAATGRISVIGGKASGGSRLRLGRAGKIVGRVLFLGYVFVAVVLPLVGLLYVSGVGFWSPEWPETWNPINNIEAALANEKVQKAILNSVTLATITAFLLMTAAQVLSFGQRLFPRLGQVVDGFAKSPAGIAHVLIAMGLLLAFGGEPFKLGGTGALLVIGYFMCYLPFASVVTTGAQQLIGRDIMEAAKMAGATDFRTFRSILTPLTRSALVGGFLLVFVLTSGDVNLSLILASGGMPVIGFLMLDYYEFGGFPQVATFALLITLVSLSCCAVIVKLLSGSGQRGDR